MIIYTNSNVIIKERKMIVKKNNLYVIVISLMIIIASIVVFLSPKLPLSYKGIALLPISYGIIMIFSSKFHILAKKYLGIKIVYIVMFLRYVMLPIFIAISGDISGIGKMPLDKYILPSFFLMIWELIVCVVVINIAGDKFLLKENVQLSSILKNDKSRNVVYSLVVFVSFIFVIIFPSLIQNFQFFNVTEEGTKTISYFYGLDIRLLLISKVIIYSYIIKKYSTLYKNKKNKKYYYICLVASIIYIGIIRSDNRTNILIDIICVIVVMYHSFPSFRKKSIILIGLSGIILVSSVSMYRMFAETSWRAEVKTREINLARTLQAYISGPRNVAFSIETADIFKYNIDINTLFNDLFAWTGYFASIFKIDIENITNQFFNMTIYMFSPTWSGYGDQIIPVIGQGFIYLGYIGAPIFSAIICLTIVFIDRIRCKSDTIYQLIITTFLVSRLALFMGLSITILMMFILDSFLQLWIVDKANSLFKIRYKRLKV